MKFSEITEQSWQELKPYLDTCVIPVTGMSGNEAPFEAVNKLEQLRDFLDLIEVPFMGRTVTYPAYHYVNESDIRTEWRRLDEVAKQLKQYGFRHVVVMSIWNKLPGESCEAIDLVLAPSGNGSASDERQVRKQVEELWNRSQFSEQL